MAVKQTVASRLASDYVPVSARRRKFQLLLGRLVGVVLGASFAWWYVTMLSVRWAEGRVTCTDMDPMEGTPLSVIGLWFNADCHWAVPNDRWWLPAVAVVGTGFIVLVAGIIGSWYRGPARWVNEMSAFGISAVVAASVGASMWAFGWSLIAHEPDDLPIPLALAAAGLVFGGAAAGLWLWAKLYGRILGVLEANKASLTGGGLSAGGSMVGAVVGAGIGVGIIMALFAFLLVWAMFSIMLYLAAGTAVVGVAKTVTK